MLNTPTQNMTQPITILVGAGKSGILKVETVLDHGSGHSYQWCKRVKGMKCTMKHSISYSSAYICKEYI